MLKQEGPRREEGKQWLLGESPDFHPDSTVTQHGVSQGEEQSLDNDIRKGMLPL